MEIQCKSCGSVRFRQITPKIFECEYCGRKIEDTKVSGSMYSIASIGSIILNPTRTITFLPPPNYGSKYNLNINAMIKKLICSVSYYCVLIILVLGFWLKNDNFLMCSFGLWIVTFMFRIIYGISLSSALLFRCRR